jgi:hypothetical protein
MSWTPEKLFRIAGALEIFMAQKVKDLPARF